MTPLDLERSTSVHVLPLTGAHPEPDLQQLEELIEYSAQLLPAHGPIGGFAFQNPLHALEYLPFDEAVQAGSKLFGCQPYLPEARYRKALETGRIQAVDLRSILEDDPRPWDRVSRLTSRLHLRLTMLLNPICGGKAPEIEWLLSETDVLARFPAGTPAANRMEMIADVKRWAVRDLINAGSTDGAYRKPGPNDPRRLHLLWPLFKEFTPQFRAEDRLKEDWADPVWESFTLRGLWAVCRDGVRRAQVRPAPEPTPGERPRNLLLRVSGADSDRYVHDLLIRFSAAFTDQGVAHWKLPGREQGFFRCFLDLYGRAGGPPDSWLTGLTAELKRLRKSGMGPMDSIRESLDLLGIAEEEWPAFLPATVAALRGWASIIRQMEVRSDRVAHPVPRGTLIEFLAVRLILERLALAFVAREELGYTGQLSGLRAALRERATPEAPNEVERAYPIFQLALRAGWKATALYDLSPAEWGAILDEVEAFNDLERRRLFHAAYERRLRTQALDALAARVAKPPRGPQRPQFQSVYCLDAREESFRRHLEEVCPDAETFGHAGFYGIPIYYRGLGDAFPSAQCPIVMRPQHWVVEEPVFQFQDEHHKRAKVRQVIGSLSHQLVAASHSGSLGAIISLILGNLASIPLVAMVLFPRWTSWIARLSGGLVEPPPVTRLVIERTAPAPGPEDGEIGFNLEEMTNMSERLLRDIGLTTRFSRLVFIFGHGSMSLNNPHLAAYNCGACAGNRGGPNARAAALMLNDPRVRAKLAGRGLEIPADTVFVGGTHNTGDETITFYDLDVLPRSHFKDIQTAQDALERACHRNARERCRRFDSAPLNITPEAAHAHVHRRTVDLAQTRAEFGNASNAMCFVGRRDRIRGLFMDRRSFLQSYDPTADTPQGTILARLLSAVIPVCSGINLEYYCSAVDSPGWGCGSKLPHNVVGLLGVMDGTASDLRMGLPWQGVEIHEPVRILFVLETTPEAILGIMAANPVIDRIVRNGWAQLALLDPSSTDLLMWSHGEFQPYQTHATKLPVAPSSAEWYNGCREHLEFADITANAG